MISTECPICGHHKWIVVGWPRTDSFTIGRIRCAQCGYDENYVEPKDRKICGRCDVEHNRKIGMDEPKYNPITECPKCGKPTWINWNGEELEIDCPYCHWNSENKTNWK
jgi:transcription elongation factor Elf1